MFAVLGVPVYYADARAKALMADGGPLADGIVALFGQDAYLGGQLNRSHLAALAFADPALNAALNALTHPAVEADYEIWALGPWPAAVPYTLKEAALLFEAGTYSRVDAVLTVEAPMDLRMARTLARDPGRDEAQVRAIVARQLPEAERRARAQYVIDNDGERSIIEQVLAVDGLIRSTAQIAGYDG